MHDNRETVIILQTIIVPTKSIIVASLIAKSIDGSFDKGRGSYEISTILTLV